MNNNDTGASVTRMLANWLISIAQRKEIELILIFSIAINALHLVIPIFTLQLFDRVLMSESIDTLIWLTCIALFLLVMQASLDWIRSQLMLRKALAYEAKHNASAFSNAINDTISKRKSSAQAINDVSQVRDVLASPSIFGLFDAPFSPLFLFVLYLLHPMLGLYASISALLLMALAELTRRKTKQLEQSTKPANQTFNNLTQDWINSADIVQTSGFTSVLANKWQQERSGIASTTGYFQSRIRSLASLSKFTRFVLQTGLLVVCIILVLNNQISAGVLIAASMLMARVLAPIDQAINHWSHWKQGRQAHQRVTNRAIQVSESPLPLPPLSGEIQALDVVLNPTPSMPPLINKSSFHIKPGEIVGIIGETGSGKTELAKALIGLTSISEGEITLDNACINQWANKPLGQQIGYLPQDACLLAGTVTQNICRFDGFDDAKHVVEAAKCADAHNMILSLPQGYQTVVGDVGHTLSKGQQQKIALARTIYKAPKLLVLDEPDNGLDHKGLIKLYQLLERNRVNKTTTIIVSHKGSILSKTDSVLAIQADRSVIKRSTAQYLNTDRLTKPSVGGSAS
ncbi:type I secretion system permease/ATPase [Paraferrimonas haliotis]|uniref:type I secretion system permease/ATPase n=1 Tax=Paraferrimonas haliotis TaxID=2013866 RepID=UPI000F7A6414|nr:ATP-binding cassette domain-containing protein [Paraferrimonas haliotis]